MCLEDNVDLKLQYVFSYTKLATFLAKNTRGKIEMQRIKANFRQHINFCLHLLWPVGLSVRSLFTLVRPDYTLRVMCVVVLDPIVPHSKTE